MRITVVGPAFPWSGGLPLLVTELAHRLTDAGHDVVLQTWSRQGPKRLLPTQRRRLTSPETKPYPTLDRPLSWRNPLQWWRRGTEVGRSSDLMILVHYTFVQAPALTVIGALASRTARVAIICANAAPHESAVGDRLLKSLLLGTADFAVVHTAAESNALRRITMRPIRIASLPPHLPDGQRLICDDVVSRQLLFFGKVRHYKGVDVLLRALVHVKGVRLIIAGEIYPGLDDIVSLIHRLELADRVHVKFGYVPADEIPSLFATVDALVLPYRSATASQMVALASRHGTPTIATRVGNFPDEIRTGVNGLLCSPDDVFSLAGAINDLYSPGTLDQLRSGGKPTHPRDIWQDYLNSILSERV